MKPVRTAAQRPSALDRIERLWETRRCNICQRLGRCPHREPAVELAEMEAAEQRLEPRPVPNPKKGK